MVHGIIADVLGELLNRTLKDVLGEERVRELELQLDLSAFLAMNRRYQAIMDPIGDYHRWMDQIYWHYFGDSKALCLPAWVNTLQLFKTV